MSNVNVVKLYKSEKVKEERKGERESVSIRNSSIFMLI